VANELERLRATLATQYRLDHEIGRGGMATVYLATDVRHDRRVAVKVLSPELAAAIGPERFLREIGITARLAHPHILPLLASGDADGLLYYIMPYVDGESLRDRLDRETQLPIDDAVQIAREVADALAYAHSHDVVHRDIKPENILLGSGHAVVADFGIARALTAASGGPLTGTGIALGTPAYMSPEQSAGDTHLDGRSDIYSLGCVLYEMLAGSPPFSGPTVQSLLARHAVDPVPPIHTVRSTVPHALERVVLQALAKVPADRFATARQLHQALARTEPGTTSTLVNPPESRSFRSAPSLDSTGIEQDIRYCTTADGVRLAYSVVGRGPVLVRVLGHFTHLTMEWEWPDLRRFWEGLAERHTLVRYDGRGIGLSDRYTGDFTEETRQLDLDAVLGAVGAGTAALLGISEGGWTAATYATRYPERISHLILYGAYCRGAQARPGYDAEEDRALMTLIRKGWGRETPAFRQIFTTRFFGADADPALIAHFNEMQRASADPETAARYEESCHRRGAGHDLFRQLTVPTLVIHCREDVAVSAEEGRLLASLIPGAQLVLLPSGTHYFPTAPGVVTRVVAAITRFLQTVA
jgi:pimeloyl-ACP methyl ester carboxylesterase/tRNA A-37 threonylcarbamoyl transferase component Bud32